MTRVKQENTDGWHTDQVDFSRCKGKNYSLRPKSQQWYTQDYGETEFKNGKDDNDQ
jgi:hypothetical protein